MSEIKNIETAVKNEVKAVATDAKAVETKVTAEVTSVKSDVTKTAEELYGGAKKFSADAIASVKSAFVAISNDEKLVVTGIENEFLKTQIEIQRLQLDIEKFVHAAEAAQKKFDAVVTTLARKYAVDPAKYAFDIASKTFKAIETAVKAV